MHQSLLIHFKKVCHILNSSKRLTIIFCCQIIMARFVNFISALNLSNFFPFYHKIVIVKFVSETVFVVQQPVDYVDVSIWPLVVYYTVTRRAFPCVPSNV